MTDDQKTQQNQSTDGPEPIFNLPGIITALCGLIIAVHIAAQFLDVFGQQQLTFWFGYLPLRWLALGSNPMDALPLLWTPFTHAFLHAGWEHLIINTAWLAIFGTPVARRYGTGKTLLLFLVSSAAGAAAFTATSLSDGYFLVGASGAIAGLTGAAVRFIFQPTIVGRHPETGEAVVLGKRLATIPEVFRNPRSRWFTIIWVGLNAAVPLFPLLTGGVDSGVAWQAHLGGFIVGFFMVPLFERRAA